MKMNKAQFEAIKMIIDIIDQQLQEPLYLEEIAECANISKYHFHRLFKSITGKSIMTYVRARKLSMSIFDLLNTDLKIIDIANNYHFEHEQSYIRAFKQKFNMTPAQCRKLNHEIPIEPKIDTNQMLYIGQGLIAVPRISIVPKFHVQGLMTEIVHEENLFFGTANALMEKYRDIYLPIMKNVIDESIYIGLVQYTSNPQHSNYYTSCTPVTSLDEVMDPLVTFTIPMGEYAIFRYVGFHSPFELSYSVIKSLYDYIDVWIANTAYIQSHPFHFERVNLKICSDSYCEMDIYTPIM